MNRLFEKARAAVASLAKGRSVAWDVASLAPVHGSEPLLLLVWTHLLSNALRFTATREQAHIRVTAGERPDGWIVTSVTDDGVGFDPRGKDRLFGVFERLHGEESGLGTGLATVRRVIERHGGEVCAEGAVGAGATFSFTLPPATATTARAEDAGP
jgi:signal transduction histidine kinase